MFKLITMLVFGILMIGLFQVALYLVLDTKFEGFGLIIIFAFFPTLFLGIILIDNCF